MPHQRRDLRDGVDQTDLLLGQERDRSSSDLLLPRGHTWCAERPVEVTQGKPLAQELQANVCQGPRHERHRTLQSREGHRRDAERRQRASRDRRRASGPEAAAGTRARVNEPFTHLTDCCRRLRAGWPLRQVARRRYATACGELQVPHSSLVETSESEKALVSC